MGRASQQPRAASSSPRSARARPTGLRGNGIVGDGNRNSRTAGADASMHAPSNAAANDSNGLAARSDSSTSATNPAGPVSPHADATKFPPPGFEGNVNDDLELWSFSAEQYYSDFKTEMHELSSSFSDMVFANLGVDAQAWFRDVKLSMGPNPLAWALFKERIRAPFRDKDFKYKTLLKMFELKPTKSQQEYTSRFLHLLSQVDT
ncbi:hypothetical protein ON010_g6685 [Phytophthora cinnamomi]|nr:hypothetical protein ON010_g6685 [Phytophthora cinnamomi]